MIKRKLNIVSILLFAFLFVPFLQSSFHLFEIKPLKGGFLKSEKPKLNFDDWWNGILKDSTEIYLRDHLGFYEDFVRLNNQINYSIFDVVNAKNIVQGKKNQYMDVRYINEYTGENHIYIAHLDRKIYQLKKLQDTLAKEGFPFILVLEPSKSRLYPELIPNRYKKDSNKSSNYDRLVMDLDSLGVAYLDMNNYFHTIKDTVKWPLFADLSVHWSTYGMVLALDSIIKYTNQISVKKIRQFRIKEIEVDNHYRTYIEYDIGDAMNIFCEIPQRPLAYPKLDYSDDSINRPSALFVADSYFFNIRGSGITEKIFSYFEFWYYFKTRFVNREKKTALDLKGNIKDQVKKFDLLYLMQSELTYNDFGWDFIERLYESYFPDDRETRYEYFIRHILKSQDWIDKIKAESKLNNLTPEECLINNAIFMLAEENRLVKSDFLEDYYLIFNYGIKGDSAWLALLKKKAKEKNISLDEMIRIDAQWMFNKDHSEKRKKKD